MGITDLLLQKGERDLNSERGVSCDGELPAASDPQLVERAKAARAALGSKAMVLGHHYQRDEVIAFADIRGDSFKLAQAAADNSEAEFIFFCGVHFMAESADILTTPNQKVILPDLSAGCSMADMATASQVNDCWQVLGKLGVAAKTIPITYMNSSAAIKAFTGKNNGAVCTSSNAARAMKWAFENGEKILFLPDQHLGRNTAVLSLGLTLNDCVLWNPWKPNGGLTDDQIKKSKVILWRGHCSVHGRFSIQNINDVRQQVPGIKVLVHPECQHEVVSNADVVGSTEMIIKTVRESAPGSKWAIGTELNLVSRLANENLDKQVVFLDKTVCYCSTMNRIDLPHLVWVMESLVSGRLVNQIKVEAEVAKYAKVALERMLALP
ncbi:quinolinate synthase [Candidatus Nanopelagicus abundans]|jgi:quinolinate synthase|uniref:Quinolinate synthase n=1 Tax=Candidatus Nanopelagicus abundans TaxID=1884916 RepID=A0A249L449_9ACTN|nr:quinolinate synthase NadA [Candidatus Nanopelagicus abundans]ASY23787.1 quinolinate synthase [Candidatus Nanopelagicus abundans]